MVPQYVNQVLTLTNHNSGYTHHGYTSFEFTQAKAVAKATKNSAFNDTKQDRNIYTEREGERERERDALIHLSTRRKSQGHGNTIIVDRCIVNMFIQTLALHKTCFNHLPRRSRTSWRGWSRRMRRAAGFTHVSSLQAIFTCMAHTYVHAPLHVHVHPFSIRRSTAVASSSPRPTRWRNYNPPHTFKQNPAHSF